MRTRRMNLKLLSVSITAILGIVFTTLSFSSQFLFSTLQGVQQYSSDLVSIRKIADLRESTNQLTEKSLEKESGEDITVTTDEKPVAISHVFSPYVMNDEFIIVSKSWYISAERARKNGIEVEHICAVLPEDVKACPTFARQVTLEKRIENYRNKANALPSYGEMFTVLRDQAKGKYVMYSNADIGTVPDYYTKVWRMVHEDLSELPYQMEKLTEARSQYYKKCAKMNWPSSQDSRVISRAEGLCARDALVYFENNGGRPPHYIQHLLRFFKNSTVTAQEAIKSAYDPMVPDERIHGHSMTITRRQFAKASASAVVKEIFTNDGQHINDEVLDRLYEEGEAHPGNDVFIVPRSHIPRLLTDTPFIHLRPSGFLIGQHLKDQTDMIWRRIVSSPEQRMTFHVGMGTDEWPVRAELQPRAVLFEVAQFFTRTNSTKESFWPPAWCQDANNYREYGTSDFCGKLPGEFCRGNVRLACTKYWHHGSRDRHALNTICYRVSGRGRTLDSPLCEFCNDLVGSESYRCNKKPAKECKDFSCS